MVKQTLQLLLKQASHLHTWKLVRWSMREEPQRKAGLQHTTVVLVRWFMYKQTR